MRTAQPKSRSRKRWFSLIGPCLFVVSAAWALEKSENPTPPSPTPANPATTVAAPIEVSAPREISDERNASATTLDDKEIEHGTVRNTTDLSRRMPNVTFVDAGDRRSGTATIRGFSSNSYGNAGVITYVDDIPITDVQMFNQDLYDVERVTVIRGPSAEATHGASAEFGLLQIYTQQPSNTFEGSGTASYGNHNSVLLRAGIGGPILKDKVMFRLSMLESHRDGFLTNSFRDSHPDYRNNLAGRFQLRCLPTPELEITLTAEAQHAMDGSQTYVSLDAKDPFKVQYNVPGHLREDTTLGAMKLAYTTPAFQLTSITSRRSFETDDSHADLDFTPAPVFDFGYEYAFVQWSEEFKIRSQGEGHWKWQAGAYFEDRGTNVLFGNRIRDTTFIQGAPPAGLGLPFSAPIADFHGSHLFGQAYALFGQATFNVTDQFDVTFGARTELHRDEMETHHKLFAPAQNTVVPIFSDTGESQSKAFLPKVAASYRINSDFTVYAAGSSGYRPGGFAYLIDDPKLDRYSPEYMYNAELGVKGAWLKNKISTDLTLFYSRMDDYQVRRISNFMFRVDNADRTSSRGGEFQMSARPFKGLEFTANFGYSDAHFDKYSDRVTGESFDGHALTYASRYTYFLAAEYLHKSGAFCRAEYSGRSSVPFDEENNLEQRAYGLMNARLGLEKTHYAIFLYGKNLLDQSYGHFGIPGAGNTRIGSPGDPRTFGLEVKFTF